MIPRSMVVYVAERAVIAQRRDRIVRRHLKLPTGALLESDARFASLGLDSLDMVTIAIEAEEEFGVAVSDDEAAGCATFGAFVVLIAEKLS